MTRIVRSSPSPEELDVKVSVVDGKFDVNVNGMGAHSFNIEVVSESDQEAASSRSFSVARELFFFIAHSLKMENGVSQIPL